MLFDARQFELHFKPSVLRRGLKLFEAGSLELQEKVSPVAYVFSAGNSELTIKKRGDKVLSYHCACGSPSYCEHLAGVMFYFQADVLRLSPAQKPGRRKKLPGASLPGDEPVKRGNTKSLLNRSRTSTEADLFEKYVLKVKSLLKPYLEIGILDQHLTDRLYMELEQLIRKGSRSKHSQYDAYFLDLALVTVSGFMSALRFTGHETPLYELFRRSDDRLRACFNRGLSAIEQQAWRRGAIHSVVSNRNLKSGAFFLLVPGALQLISSRKDYEELKRHVDKRTFKVNYDEQIDKWLVTRLQVEMKGLNAPGGLPGSGEHDVMPEWFMAMAEMNFWSGSPGKGFDALENGFNVLLEKGRYNQDFVQYSIVKAREKKRNDLEVKFLERSMVFGLYILPLHIERFMQLVPEKDQKEAVHELISEIKKHRSAYLFDKIAALYMETGALDELSEELKYQADKFSIVHKIALLKFPACNDAFLSLYARHLTERLESMKFFNLQRQLLTTARVFLDKLPPGKVEKILLKVLEKYGGQTQLHRYVTSFIN